MPSVAVAQLLGISSDGKACAPAALQLSLLQLEDMANRGVRTGQEVRKQPQMQDSMNSLLLYVLHGMAAGR